MEFSWEEVGRELTAPIESVAAALKAKWEEMQNAPPLWDEVMAFVSAVDWSEPWLLGMLAAELQILVMVVFFRRNQYFQGVVFFLIASVVYNAEGINALCASHWERFATQPYFDSDGLFISTVLSGPLILIMLYMLINYLLQMVQVMVEMKRTQLRYKARQQAKAKGEAAGPPEGKKSK